MVINHNMSSLFASRKTNEVTDTLQKNIEKLSSGERINSASDDASNLAVSTKMRSQIRGLNQASKNIANATSFVKTTEGYLNETTEVLQRIRELAVQSANGIYSDEDRMMIQTEVSSLVSEIDRIASTAQFNGMNMLTGRFAEEGINFMVGANMDQFVTVKVGNADATSLGIKGQGNTISLADAESANRAIGTIDEALKKVSAQRADLGAYQNRFEMAEAGVNNAAENLTAADSVIRDTDMAEEMVSFTKNTILQQAGTAMLAQANTQSQNVITLLR